MPVISATGEGKIRRIVVLGQYQQKVSEAPSQSVSQAQWCASVIPATCRRLQVRGSQSRQAWANITPYLKNN
jgi:hypothetical protein